MTSSTDGTQSASFVVVANRLPVDRLQHPDGSVEWQRSPGGLVSAMEPVMQGNHGTWVGWPGNNVEEELPPFDANGMHLVPVTLSEEEIVDYYEGFANGTLWPLYHDLTGEPVYERCWWNAYRSVNQRFADITAEQASKGATIWVQDYQLQLVPGMLRAQRPDLKIGFFNHIPFPGYELYARLPWRRQVIEGLLGSDLIGFQRRDDAANFLRAARRLTGSITRGSVIELSRPRRRSRADTPERTESPHRFRSLRAAAFPISVDAALYDQLARRPDVAERARELRARLGNPRVLLLGVDRLDYTKGIRHRLRAYGELLDEKVLATPDAVLVQVANPSRERVEEYQRLRDDVELMVGRINGEHSQVGQPAVHYLHQSFPREEMAALYLAADVMLVTPLRDGMNLVAKEYAAVRYDERGALVLSEFTGAADELTQAFMVNPWDIDGLKHAIVRAVEVSPGEAARRMRAMRRRVFDFDVHHWANTFLGALEMSTDAQRG